MTDIKRNIKPFIFCLLSTALSVFCLYGFRSALLSDATSHLNISRYTFLNNIIDAVINFDNTVKLGYLLFVGFLALIFELSFSNSMYEFFSRIPLGSIKKYDYFDSSRQGFKYKIKHSFAVLSPAVITGFYVLIHLVICSEFPEYLNICVERIFPISVILVLIASLALTVSVIKYGGLWGMLVRLPLLFTSNLCLCTGMGFLIITFGVFIVTLFGFIFIILLLPLIIKIMIRA